MRPDRLVVGLGNPGRTYQGTRHNAGYMVMAALAAQLAAGKPKRQFQGDVLDVTYKGQNVLLLCPTTFMNLSGQSVAAAAKFYKLDAGQLLVICDDMDLPVGRIRLRSQGSSGGQKGLKDIISRLGTDQFSRLRLGIGHPDEGRDVADYVLSGFRSDEKAAFSEAVQKAAQAVTCWLTEGPDTTMNRFN